jgi:alpha-tubulin suppressor-like RCC1 family protein
MRTIRVVLSTLLCLAGLLALPMAAPPAGAQQPEGFLAGIAQVEAGDGHTCARLTDGQVRCWGDNDAGAIGDGTTLTERHLPTTVLRPDGLGPLTGVRSIEVGDHSCALVAGGQARCWGPNDFGELGDGTTTGRPLPVAVKLRPGVRLTGITQLSAGDGTTCARLSDRRARCWGRNNYGQVGDGTPADERHRPRLVTVPGGGALTGVRQVSVGRDHACALLDSGQVRCWGDNDAGRLGDGTTQDRRRARVVKNPAGTGPLTGAIQVVAGDGPTCALLRSGQVRCWGENQYGAVGDGTFEERHLPVPVKNPAGTGRLTGVRRLGQAYGAIVCARVAGNQLRCWGRNIDGGLGNGETDDSPLPVTVLDPSGTIPLGNVAQVSAGSVFTCARLANGHGRCWGDNSVGELGDGTTDEHHLPVVVEL